MEEKVDKELIKSNTVGEKHENVENVPENTAADKQTAEEKVEISVKTERENNAKSDETTSEQISAKENEIEEIIEEEEVEESGDSDDAEEEEDNQKITEEVVETPDDTEIKTTIITTVKKVIPETTTTVKTTSSVTREQPTETIATPQTEEETIKTTETAVKEAEEAVKQEEPQAEQDASESEEETEAEEEEEETQTVNEVKQPDESIQQQSNKDQIPQENETQPQLPLPTTTPTTTVKEETVVDAPSVVTQTNQHDNMSNKQENLNNTIKDIISNIDSNIQAQENIAALKERELELLKKQQELAKEIEQQKLLAQKLASENQYNQQLNNNYINQNYGIMSKPNQPITNVSKYSTVEESQDNNVYSRKSETIETRESTNVTKKIDLHKIFTPATDAEEILPKNRKLYASSAFYSPSLHPTVEDQVELARRISHSLSDISNHQSRGQSMYVNRKKRSVKWVHEGSGQDDTENENVANEEEYDQEKKENDVCHQKNVPLKFLMNPYGQMRDINSLRESLNTETGLLSPDVSAEVVNALQAQTGKGAELFAKRRKVAEKWVVDESNVGAQSPSGLPDYHQYQQQPKASTSPSILPAYTDAAKHRVQLNLHQEQLLEKYTKPGLKVVQTPWEAALNSGSASAAFVEEQKLSPFPSTTLTPSPTPQIYDASQGGIPIPNAPTATDSYSKSFSKNDYQSYQTQHSAPYQQNQHERQLYAGTNSKRELAYKPSIPQGWKAPSMSLPTDNNLVDLKIERNVAENEMKHVQQQQHITTVNEAVKSCEEFNTKDDTELIDLIYNNNAQKKVSSCATLISGQSVKHLLNTEVHEFVDHLIKSPELRVSPIPIKTQVIYDNAVRELHEKQLKETRSEIQLKESNQEREEKVNVRKQLQQYEDLHRQYAKQIEQDELMQKKREAAKLKALQQNCLKQTIQSSEGLVKSSVQQTIEQQKEEEEYVKVPVKDLITNFEQQLQQQEEKSNQTAATSSTLEDNENLEMERQKDENIKSINEDLYMPKEIPLQSYAPPPVANIPSPVSPYSSNASYETNQYNAYKPLNSSQTEAAPPTAKTYGVSTSFPVSKPYQQGFSSTYGNSQPPKQQYLPPQSYQKVPQNSSQNVPQVNFNPSPLPYDKLAKFENPPADEGRQAYSPSSRASYLNVRGSKVRNTSPAPFTAADNRPFTPSSDSHYYGGAPSISPRPLSSTQQYSGHNTPNLSHPSVTPSQLLNAPTYNTPARGWGCGGSTTTGHHYPQSHLMASKPQIVNASSMPYTDF